MALNLRPVIEAAAGAVTVVVVSGSGAVERGIQSIGDVSLPCVWKCGSGGQAVQPIGGSFPYFGQDIESNTRFSEVEDEESRVVIGKLRDLAEPGAVHEGERTLLGQLPDQGSEEANWEQNERVLKNEMERGIPIRDASVDPVTGQLRDDTGFLAKEREVLRTNGWSYDPTSELWSPPR